MEKNENEPTSPTAYERKLPQTSELKAQPLLQSQNIAIKEQERLLQEPMQKIRKLENGIAFSTAQHEQAPDIPKHKKNQTSLFLEFLRKFNSFQYESQSSLLASENGVLKIVNCAQEQEKLLEVENYITSSCQEEKHVNTDSQSQYELPVNLTTSVLASECETLRAANYQTKENDPLPQQPENLPVEVDLIKIVNSPRVSKILLEVENYATSSDQEEKLVKTEPQSRCELPVDSIISALASESKISIAANNQTEQNDHLPQQFENLSAAVDLVKIVNSPQQSKKLLEDENYATSSNQEEKPVKIELQGQCELPVNSTRFVFSSENETLTATNYQTEQNDHLPQQFENLLAAVGLVKIVNSPQQSKKLLEGENYATSSNQEEKPVKIELQGQCELPANSTRFVFSSENETLTATNYQTEQNDHLAQQFENLPAEVNLIKINSPLESKKLLEDETCATSSDQEEKPVKTEPQCQHELPLNSIRSEFASESGTITAAANYQTEQNDPMPQQLKQLPAEHLYISPSKRVEIKPFIIKDFLQDTEYESWSNDTSSNCAYRLITLVDNSPEFKKVKQAFTTTNKRFYNVTKIQKVINPYLLIQYKLTKNLYRQKYKHVDEKMLFHGTKKSNVDSICKYNFNWRLNGHNRGYKFGKGVSFSPIAYYATHYSDNDSDKVMILANVLVSSHYVGNDQTIVPKLECDTTTNMNQQVFVKYDDNTFYPAYTVEYGLKYSNSDTSDSDW